MGLFIYRILVTDKTTNILFFTKSVRRGELLFTDRMKQYVLTPSYMCFASALKMHIKCVPINASIPLCLSESSPAILLG